MPEPIKFIDTKIRSLKPSKERKVYWCIGCPGFGIRITPSGTKSFVFKYKTKSQKDRWITIGRYPAISIHEARREYDTYYEQVYNLRRDLVAENKNASEKQANTKNIREFSSEYIAHERLKGKVSIDEEKRVFELDVIPVIGNLLPEEVTGNHIDDIQSNILKRAKKSAIASRGGKSAIKHTLAYTRQLFDYINKQRNKNKEPEISNPVFSVESLGESGKRDRVLSFEEIWKFWHGIEHVGPSFVTAKALKFMLVTMQRSIEIRNFQHGALKASEGVWEMQRHETKNRTMHRVPLNRHALEIIAEVQSYTQASPYVFSATRAKSPPKTLNPNLKPLGKSALSQAMRDNRGALNIEDVTPHDLRRTGATWIVAVGLPKVYSRLVLNHSDGDSDVTGEVYIQYAYDFEKQQAAKVWEYVLNQIISCKSIEDIPTLKEMRKLVGNSGLLIAREPSVPNY